MLNQKKIKLGFLTLSTAALSIFAFPFIQSNAAPSTMDLVNQMYNQVAGQKQSNINSNLGSYNTGSYNTGSYNTGTGKTSSSSKGTNTTGSTSTPSANRTTSSQSSMALADRIIATGEKYLGTPYQYGAPSGQTRTFDCSSFTQFVFKQNGISLLRSSRQQYTQGTSVARSQLQKGDLLFFTTSHSGGKIGHVGIYAGNNKVLHTWGPGGVRYDSLSTGWLNKGYVGAKRVIK